MDDKIELLTRDQETAITRHIENYVKTIPEEKREHATASLNKIVLERNGKLFLDYIEATKKMHQETATLLQAKKIPGYDHTKNPKNSGFAGDAINDAIRKAGIDEKEAESVFKPFEKWVEKTETPFERKIWEEVTKNIKEKKLVANWHVLDAAEAAVKAELKAEMEKNKPAPKVEPKTPEAPPPRSSQPEDVLQSLAEFNRLHADSVVALPPKKKSADNMKPARIVVS